jgi:ferredoxin/flavodoxin---NADP+ reductase
MRVAVVGAGPSGIYAAEHLASEYQVEVDVFDTLPVPFGLVRYGVAPDHFAIRSVRDKLAQTFENPLVRFRGNVTIGRDLTAQDLQDHYDAVVYTYGASLDRELGIPGEDHPMSIAATAFVRWYTGHPDATDFGEQLSRATEVCVVGLGNVAIDVTRILIKPASELMQTDIPQHVLDSLASSSVKKVHVVGRRGPANATFTTKELKELGEIPGVDVIVNAKDIPSDREFASGGSKIVARNLDVMSEWATRKVSNAKSIEFHFFSAPDALDLDRGILRVKEMAIDENGRLSPTGSVNEIQADLVVRSIGYRGEGLHGLPFDHVSNVIPNNEGSITGLESSYVAGWIKRGPSGIIGTNKKDAVSCVNLLVHDHKGGQKSSAANIDQLLADRGVRSIDFQGWNRIDEREKELGASRGRERTSIHEREELIRIGLGV